MTIETVSLFLTGTPPQISNIKTAPQPTIRKKYPLSILNMSNTHNTQFNETILFDLSMISPKHSQVTF